MADLDWPFHLRSWSKHGGTVAAKVTDRARGRIYRDAAAEFEQFQTNAAIPPVLPISNSRESGCWLWMTT
jgi:hypothetical protein